MTGEQIRRRGLVVAAVGLALVAWVVVFAAMAEVGNPQVLVATAVSGALVCLCPVAGGVVAARITDAASAARVRHVFVVLEGAALAIVFPFWWFSSGVQPVGEPEGFALVTVLALMVPVVTALTLAIWNSHGVHKIVVDAFGPVAPDSGTSAQRIRLLGVVLVTVGVALSIAVVALAITESYWLVFLIFGLLVTLAPVLLGASLARMTDVYPPRRRNVGLYLYIVVVPIGTGLPVAKVGSIGGSSGMLFGALIFAAVVLLVIALLVMREHIGLWDRPWRERKRAVSR